MSGRGLRKRLAASNSSPSIISTPKKRGDDSSEEDMPRKRRRIRKKDALAEDEAPKNRDFYDDILKIVSSKGSAKASDSAKKVGKATKNRTAVKEASPVKVSSPVESSPVSEKLRDRLGSPELGMESPEPPQAELPEQPKAKPRKRNPLVKRKARASDGPPIRQRRRDERRRQTIQLVQQRTRESESPSAQLEQEDRESAKTLEGCKQSFLHLRRLLGRSAWTNDGSAWMDKVDSDSLEWRETQLEKLTLNESKDFVQKAWTFGNACRSHGLASFLSKLQRSMKQLTTSMKNIQDCRVRYTDLRFRAKDKQKRLLNEVRHVLIPLLFHELNQVLEIGIVAESDSPGMSISFAGILRSVLIRVKDLNFKDKGANDETDNDMTGLRANAQLDDDKNAFWRHVDYAIDRLDSIINDHIAACAVRDSVIRQAKAEAEEERKRERHLRMEQFILSTQKREEESIVRGKGKQAEWKLNEDDLLLGIIRSTQSPNLEVVASMLHGRSSAEVGERIRHLREKFRRVFSKSGVEPPQWCYEG